MICPIFGSCWDLGPASKPHLGLLTIIIMILIVAAGIAAFLWNKERSATNARRLGTINSNATDDHSVGSRYPHPRGGANATSNVGWCCWHSNTCCVGFRDLNIDMHAFNQRILAEDLVRVRRPDERERYAAAQRQARIDPNPHQIDAVIFALRRLREGGCILADEVGLGKTIEAGLVIAQSRAEGAQRILLIVPKSLIGQWQNELLNLFGIQARENETSFFAPGVYLVGREFAGSERGATPLGAAPPFDLAVIDEAHEIFAGLHKRYGRDGIYDETSDEALMAHRVRGFLRSTPVLLLTATPMQNSLAELWGLVQYVEPTGTLLGDIATFRKVFCSDDDRTLIPGQEHELKRRLAMVQQRTLRRQAQEFLDRPFTQRRCRLYEYAMSDDERSLYDDVTEYLLEPSLFAFSGRQRRLLLIGFHRRMASSISALAASLENVAARLRRLQQGLSADDTVIERASRP